MKLTFQPFLIPGLRLPSSQAANSKPEAAPAADLFPLVIAEKLTAWRQTSIPLLLAAGSHSGSSREPGKLLPFKKDKAEESEAPNPTVIRQTILRLDRTRVGRRINKEHPEWKSDRIEEEILSTVLKRQKEVGRCAKSGDINAFIALAASTTDSLLGFPRLVLIVDLLEKNPHLLAILESQAVLYPQLVLFLNQLRTVDDYKDLRIPMSLRKQAALILERLDLNPFLDGAFRKNKEAVSALFQLYKVLEDEEKADRIRLTLIDAGRDFDTAADVAVGITLREMKLDKVVYQDLLPLLKISPRAVDLLKETYLSQKDEDVLPILCSAAEESCHAAAALCDILESEKESLSGTTWISDINLELFKKGEDRESRSILSRMRRLGHSNTEPPSRPADKPRKSSDNVIALSFRKNRRS